MEAGRWLARQRELYERQKLLRVRVRLLKEALGERGQEWFCVSRENPRVCELVQRQCRLLRVRVRLLKKALGERGWACIS